MSTDWIKTVVATALAVAGCCLIFLAVFTTWQALPLHLLLRIGALWVIGLATCIGALYVSGEAQ